MERKSVFTLTIDFIRDRFNEYNGKYFGGFLTVPKFAIMHRKRTLGLCHYANADYKISVSDYYCFDERSFCQIILHEMIHLYIRQKGLKDTRTHHGKVFYSIADRINKDGWNIGRTINASGFAPRRNIKRSDGSVEYCLVAFRSLHGAPFLMRYKPYCVNYYKNKFKKHPKYYTNPVWFKSMDCEKYESMTECRSGIRGRYIGENEYNLLISRYGNKRVLD